MICIVTSNSIQFMSDIPFMRARAFQNLKNLYKLLFFFLSANDEDQHRQHSSNNI